MMGQWWMAIRSLGDGRASQSSAEATGYRGKSHSGPHQAKMVFDQAMESYPKLVGFDGSN